MSLEFLQSRLQEQGGKNNSTTNVSTRVQPHNQQLKTPHPQRKISLGEGDEERARWSGIEMEVLLNGVLHEEQCIARDKSQGGERVDRQGK